MAGELHEISAAIGALRELVGIVLDGQKSTQQQLSQMSGQISDVKSDLAEVKESVAVAVTEQANLKDRIGKLEIYVDGLRVARWKIIASGSGLAAGSGLAGSYANKLIAFFTSSHIPM